MFGAIVEKEVRQAYYNATHHTTIYPKDEKWANSLIFPLAYDYHHGCGYAKGVGI
jgi:hypothetical protein